MSSDWIILFQLSFAFLALFGGAELLYHLGRMNAEFTRKIVHAGSGLLALLFPVYLHALWQVVLICAAFLLLLLLSLRFRFLDSIHAVSRKTSGSILYPVIVVLAFAFYQWMKAKTPFHHYILFYLPILVMAIADPVAALVGSAWAKRKAIKARKSNAGSLAFFAAAITVCLGLYLAFSGGFLFFYQILSCFVIAVGTTLAERYSSGGWDNFTIPLAAMLLLYLTITTGLA